MKDHRVYLKIKIKSLAAEAKIIRAEEKKHTKCNEFGYNPIRWGLRDHRVTVVRSEARHTLLAYGFLRGRSYRQMEPTSEGLPNWDRVWKMIEKYGVCWDWSDKEESSQGLKKRQAEQKERFEAWKSEAESRRGEVGTLATPRAASPSPSALEETPEPTVGKGTGHLISRGLSAVGRLFS